LRVGRAIVKVGHQIAGDFVKFLLGHCLEIYWFAIAADVPRPLATAADEDAASCARKTSRHAMAGILPNTQSSAVRKASDGFEARERLRQAT
jgi:hypothetical protein